MPRSMILMGALWGVAAQAQQTADKAVDSDKSVALIEGSSTDAYLEAGYDQPLRPQFHFSSKRAWTNDPNGMVFDGETYHLFFQHNPKASVWGNTTRGHEPSDDMVHWRQLDHPLLPYRVDGHEGRIFSRTASVDHDNSLGVQKDSQKTLCAFFTYASKPAFYQAMAYGTDAGESWTYWNEGRAVVPNQGYDEGERDPKVLWHEPTQKWVMALWVQRKPGRVRFFTSENLTDWVFAPDLMRDWAYERVDTVFLPPDDDKSNTKAVLYNASFDYEIGTRPRLTTEGNTVRLRLLIDRLTVEAYAGGAEEFRAHYFLPSTEATEPSISALGGNAKITALVIRELKSAW